MQTLVSDTWERSYKKERHGMYTSHTIISVSGNLREEEKRDCLSSPREEEQLAYRHNTKQREERLETPGESWALRPYGVSIPSVGLSTQDISETQIHFPNNDDDTQITLLTPEVKRVIYVSFRFCSGPHEQEMGSQSIFGYQTYKISHG